MPTAAYRALYAIAEDQMGYVTTAQATSIGVQPMTLVMMTRRGTLERVSRGVYRLVHFPAQPLAQYMQATLWPYDRAGVLSHETALALHELSDIDPPKVHITVPAAFRIQRAVPAYLVVHHADLPHTDVTQLERMPITTPERTIRDGIAANLGPAIIRQAIEDGRRKGLLESAIVADLERELRSAANPRNSGGVRQTRNSAAGRTRTPRSLGRVAGTKRST